MHEWFDSKHIKKKKMVKMKWNDNCSCCALEKFLKRIEVKENEV